MLVFYLEALILPHTATEEGTLSSSLGGHASGVLVVPCRGLADETASPDKFYMLLHQSKPQHPCKRLCGNFNL